MAIEHNVGGKRITIPPRSKLSDYPCPRCKGPMVYIVAPKQGIEPIIQCVNPDCECEVHGTKILPVRK